MVGVRTSAWRPWAALFVVHVGFAGKHGVHGSYFRNSSATDQQEQQGTVAAMQHIQDEAPNERRQLLPKQCAFKSIPTEALASAGDCPKIPGAMPPPTRLDEQWPCLLQDLILPERKKSSWNRYYNKVTDFIDMKFPGRAATAPEEGDKKPVRVVEIGTAWGGNADWILFKLPGVELFAVDPVIADYDTEDGQSKIMHNVARSRKTSPVELSQAWANGLAAHGHFRHKCRYHLHHMKSTEAVQYFEDGSVDVIFVDGLHTYEGVRDDLHAWWPKLNKEDGIAIFNDYEKSATFPGVRKAVDEFMVSKGLKARISAEPPGAQNAYVLLNEAPDARARDVRERRRKLLLRGEGEEEGNPANSTGM